MIQNLTDCGGAVLVTVGKVYTKQERARAVLFDGVPLDSFALAFVWGGVPYYKKTK